MHRLLYTFIACTALASLAPANTTAVAHCNVTLQYNPSQGTFEVSCRQANCTGVCTLQVTPTPAGGVNYTCLCD